MKRSFDCAAIVFLMVILSIVVGCSGESETPQTGEQVADKAGGYRPVGKELVTLKDSLEYNINMAMERLRLGDKSGLFENEFEYYLKIVTFDEYLKQGPIRSAQADTLTHVDVVDVTPYGHDSVDVSVVVRFEGKSGVPTRRDDRITMYYHNGRWIKPTMSNIDGQVEYEKSGGK